MYVVFSRYPARFSFIHYKQVAHVTLQEGL
jgi:hypothetical protein